MTHRAGPWYIRRPLARCLSAQISPAGPVRRLCHGIMKKMWSFAAHVLGVSFLAPVLVSPLQAASRRAKGPGQSGGVRRLPWRGRQWRRRSSLAAARRSGRRLHRLAIGRFQIRCAAGTRSWPAWRRHVGAGHEGHRRLLREPQAQRPAPPKASSSPSSARNSTAAAMPRWVSRRA